MATKTQKTEDQPSGSAEFATFFATHAPDKVGEFLHGQLNAWKKHPVHVGVTGSSGQGKSSLINALRELTADDRGAAPVGVVECTRDLLHYVHPKNEQLKFWDLPGVGTPSFPQGSYLNKVKFDRYDFFVIVSSTRFTSEDTWLALEVAKRGKSFFFVHSKIDEDIENDEEDNPDTHSPLNVIKTVRDDCKEKLAQKGFTGAEVFLVSNYSTTMYDFPHMTERFMECLPEQKKEAWRMSMMALSEEAVREKRAILQKTLWISATASAGAAAIPIPGLDIAVDLALLNKMQNYYIQQFRLDEEGLKDLAASSGKTVQELKANIPQVTNLVAKGVKALLMRFAKSITAEEFAKYIPIIGSVVGATISFGVTFKVLNEILSTCEEEAIKLLTFAIHEGTK